MDIDDICDCLEQAVQHYRDNADTYIKGGWYKVEFIVRVDDIKKEARAMHVQIKDINDSNPNT